MRIPLALIGSEEKLILLLKTLRIQGEYSYFELKSHKNYGTPLPDKSVDCFRYNKGEGYVDVPFSVALSLLGGININTLSQKSKIAVKKKDTCILREDQIPVLNESIQLLLNKNNVLLALRPAFGKTLCSILLSTYLSFATLIIVNRKTLLNGWSSTVEKFTNGHYWVFGTPLPSDTVDFVIVMIDALNKIDESYLSRFGTVIIDEAHMLATPKQVPAILKCKPVNLILCTATPDRDLKTTTIIESFVGNNRVVRRYDGYLKIIKYNTGIEVPVQTQKDGRTMKWDSYVKNLNESKTRNMEIIEWILKNKGKKFLVMTWGKEHASVICSLMKESGIDCDYMSGNKKGYKDASVLVGSFAKIGVGHDPASNEGWDGVHYEILILVGTTKNFALLEQLWGRAFRTERPHIVIFVDNMKTSEKHFKEMKKLAKMYSAEIMETSEVIKV